MNSFLEDCAKFNAYDSFKVVLNLWHQEYSKAEKSELCHLEKNKHQFIILSRYVKYMVYCNFIIV